MGSRWSLQIQFRTSKVRWSCEKLLECINFDCFSLLKTILYNSKEAHNHTFTCKVQRNSQISRPHLLIALFRLQIGDGIYITTISAVLRLIHIERPQFARRDSVYYQSAQARTDDAFIIICTITSSPSIPKAWSAPRQHIPKTLLDTVGELLDDASYADVTFVIAKRKRGNTITRTICASKKMLQRAEYFETSIGFRRRPTVKF